MAIVLPMLLLVVGGLVDFGRAYYLNVVITNAAREGARMVAMSYTTGQADVRVTQAAVGLGGLTEVHVLHRVSQRNRRGHSHGQHSDGASEQPVSLAGTQRRPVLLWGQRSHSQPECHREHAMQRMNVMIRLSRPL